MIFVNVSPADMMKVFLKHFGILPYAGHSWGYCKKGKPCIAFFDCSEDMALIVLEHEVLHHALCQIGEFAASRGIDRVSSAHRIGGDLDAEILASHTLFGVDD